MEAAGCQGMFAKMARQQGGRNASLLMLLPLLPGGGLGTYGRLLGAHHHRRNRPCTYPNYQSSARVHQVCLAHAGLSQGWCGLSTSWAMPMPTAPPRQGWQELDIGGYELTHCR
jgi:hypothetical protein